MSDNLSRQLDRIERLLKEIRDHWVAGRNASSTLPGKQKETV